MNTVNNKIIIGTIDFSQDPILNEIKIGNIEKLKNAKVEIYTNEGDNVPHIHINGLKDEICIKIFDSEYFTYGTKTGTLNKSQAKIFNSFMKSKNDKNSSKTNWEVARDIWIDSKGDKYRGPRKDSNQPDYTKLS